MILVVKLDFAKYRSVGFCPGVPVHKGMTIVLSLFRSYWLVVVYCSVFCIGSCEPVHEDRAKCSISRGLITVLLVNNYYCFGARGIASAVCSIVLSKGIKQFTCNLTTAVKGAVSRQSSSFCLVFPITRP